MITFVTGGARSGKSRFAEEVYKDREDVVYIATSQVKDKEMEDRVRMHRESRPSIWRTYEGYRRLEDAVATEENYLLDCITVLTSNIMFDISQGMERIDLATQAKIEEEIVNELDLLIKRVRKEGKNLVLVTNEVGSSIVPDHHVSRVFRDIQGRVNQRVASLSDQAYLVVAGLPVRLK